MRQSVRDLVESIAAILPQVGPVYEFGSFQVQPARVSDMRPFFPELEYVGFDSREGPGVDELASVEGTDLEDESAGIILCLDTLEHVRRPWLAALELSRLLQPGGWCLLVTVCNWPLHGEPDDFWRFTPQGMSALMEDSFPDFMTAYSGEYDFPHTVVALGWKGDPATHKEAAAILGDWCRSHRGAP